MPDAKADQVSKLIDLSSEILVRELEAENVPAFSKKDWETALRAVQEARKQMDHLVHSLSLPTPQRQMAEMKAARKG